MKKRDDDANLSCSFCGKSQREVKKLIAGPTVYICDECIELCNDIIAEEYGQEDAPTASSRVPKPREIKASLDEYVIGQESAKKILALHTGRPIEQIARDTDRDYYMSGDEAREYGLIDQVVARHEPKPGGGNGQVPGGGR